jgi:hypothetical protein
MAIVASFGRVGKGSRRRRANPRQRQGTPEIDVSKLGIHHGHVGVDASEEVATRRKIGQAKPRFSEVIRCAAAEPRLICNRERVVAVI